MEYMLEYMWSICGVYVRVYVKYMWSICGVPYVRVYVEYMWSICGVYVRIYVVFYLVIKYF